MAALNAADCVWALARSDQDNNLAVDRQEFNEVVIEILAGCRISASTGSDFDYIFETAACYCLDYEEEQQQMDVNTGIDTTAACCLGEDPLIYRAGRYPSEYLFRVCEFLESAVVHQCEAHETTAPYVHGVDATRSFDGLTPRFPTQHEFRDPTTAGGSTDIGYNDHSVSHSNSVDSCLDDALVYGYITVGMYCMSHVVAATRIPQCHGGPHGGTRPPRAAGDSLFTGGGGG